MISASGGSCRIRARACATVYVLWTTCPSGARMLARDRLVHSCLLVMTTSVGWADNAVGLGKSHPLRAGPEPLLPWPSGTSPALRSCRTHARRPGEEGHDNVTGRNKLLDRRRRGQGRNCCTMTTAARQPAV